MKLKLHEIQKKCEMARHRMAQARAEHWAFGAFNIDNQETLIAVARAAQVKNAPVLVEVTASEVAIIGADNIRDMVDNYIHEYGVEMYINLDHSPSVDDAKIGIDAGFEFIHIDISQSDHKATHQDIVAYTKAVVELARHTGAMVESEPHYFGGSSNVHTEKIDYKEVRKTFSTPEGAADFVRATGIDTYAAAIGNLHGHYPVPKKLDIELLKTIRQAIDCNISLHGGSGTPGHYFKDAVKVGVTKVNMNSDLRLAYRTTLEKVLAENPNEYAIVKLITPVINAVQKVVEDKIDLLNSADQAKI